MDRKDGGGEGGTGEAETRRGPFGRGDREGERRKEVGIWPYYLGRGGEGGRQGGGQQRLGDWEGENREGEMERGQWGGGPWGQWGKRWGWGGKGWRGETGMGQKVRGRKGQEEGGFHRWI